MDLFQREGNYPPPPGASPILGVEFSGNVAELGPNVSEWNVGDEVLGLAGGVSRTNSWSLVTSELIAETFKGGVCRIYFCQELKYCQETSPPLMG